MDVFARLRSFLVLSLVTFGPLVAAPCARAGDLLVLDQHLPALRSPVAHSHPAAPAATSASDPICDLFANGFDETGATQCAGCFDTTMDFDETDVNCGGAWCKACALGKMCLADADCESGSCTNNVCADRLLISQVQTRGDAGGTDEFVELYNPTNVTVVFDATWTLSARGSSALTYTTRLTGAGQLIAPHRHILYGSAGFAGSVTLDATLDSGISDAASLVLLHSGSNVDALCFYFSATTLTTLTSPGFICEGTPIGNLPHNDSNTGASNTDASLERKPGGAGGNMQDTADNATDFVANPTPDPHNLSSDPTP